MSMEVLVPVAGILAVFAAMLVVLKIMRSKGLSFTARVFTALGLGVLLGLGIQLLLGRDGDAATTALDWISIVGQGYIGLLKMLVMPLVFVAIVGAFTRAEVTEHFGRIAFAVLAVLLGTVTVAAVLGWGATVLTGLAHAGFLDAATPDAAELSSLASQQSEAASLTLPQEILSFIPTNPFADLAGARSTSTIAVVIFSAILGVAYIRLRDKDVDQADFFKSLIDSLYGIVMRIVAMVLGLTPYGILALIAKVMAASDYRAILGLGKFVLVSYGALLAVLCVHCLILLANRVNPATYFKKAFPVLSFAFVSRSSAGALPLNIETQHKALGVDSASANLAASFGMSIGQNGCAGVYPAMLATIVAPTVGTTCCLLRSSCRSSPWWPSARSVWQEWAGERRSPRSSCWGRWGFLSRWWPSSHPWSRSSTWVAPPSTSATPWWRALQPRMLRAASTARFWTIRRRVSPPRRT